MRPAAVAIIVLILCLLVASGLAGWQSAKVVDLEVRITLMEANRDLRVEYQASTIRLCEKTVEVNRRYEIALNMVKALLESKDGK